MSDRNRLNFKKLPGSKWTAVNPEHREKHFLVLGWVVDENGAATDELTIEAVLTGRIFTLRWRSLGDAASWRVGWK